MTDHAWVLENVAAYVAGGLEPAERERLEQHTSGCESCTAALADARALDASLAGLFAEARPNAALEDRLVQTLRTKIVTTWPRMPVPGWLAVAAAVLLLIGASGVVATQVLDPNSLAFPRVVSVYHQRQMVAERASYGTAGATHDVEELAQLWRESTIGRLDAPAGAEGLNRENNQLGRHLPVQEFSYKSHSTIHNGSASEKSPSSRISGGDAKNLPLMEGRKELEKAMPGRPTDPALPSSGSGGGMGMMGGSMTPPWASSTSMGDGSVRQTNPPVFNYFMGFYHGGPPTSATAGSSLPASQYFVPGQLIAGLSKDQKEAEGELKLRVASDKEHADPKSDNGRRLGGLKTVTDDIQVQGEDQKKNIGGEKKPPAKTDAQAGPRKIVIRTGEVEYEVASFDAAVATIARLVKNIKGGFIATVNSDKLANGKVRGSVVLRVPPENLDDLLMELRTNLGKNGELKNQRIGSQDITKQYTDLESRLKAARAMEERLLQIIKTGKGEIKDLLAVEKELGTWRTRIEEIEGELRYYANQVALSTLTITLFEKEIQAPFGIVETERVQMGLEVEEVDQALRTAQQAVREAKGRITRSEMKQHSAGQFSAILHFEVTPDAAGPLRDRLKQLGTVARLEIDRLEKTEGGTGKPTDGKTTRRDTQFQVSFYNLTNVAPRETVQINVACVEVDKALKTVLARVEKAAGRVVSSNLNSARPNEGAATVQFEIKSAEADAVLADVKATGEVMRLIVTENPDTQNTTRKKRGFHVQLWALGAVSPRETDVIQIASTDVAAAYRTVQDAVVKVKGRMLNAQLNEQDRQNVTASLDFEVRRAEEAVLRAALASAGDLYTRNVNRAPDSENVLDSKVRWQVTLINQAKIPPRESYVFGVEVNDVDQTAAVLSALVGERQGRTVKADVSRERSGRVTAELVYDVPLAKVHELLDRLRAAGTVRVQREAKHPEVPDSALAIARVDVTLSNKELIVPTDEGIGTSVRGGLSDSFKVLAWSVRILIFGLCIVLPWAIVIWAIYRLVVRLRRRTAPAAPAA